MFLGQSHVVDFTIPRNVPKSEVILQLEASSVATERNYSFTAETRISVTPPSLLTFLQTDKPMYKPGQTGM